MKLFIWNDKKFDFIEETVQFPVEDYAVVRKLFIRLLVDVSTPFLLMYE